MTTCSKSRIRAGWPLIIHKCGQLIITASGVTINDLVSDGLHVGHQWSVLEEKLTSGLKTAVNTFLFSILYSHHDEIYPIVISQHSITSLKRLDSSFIRQGESTRLIEVTIAIALVLARSRLQKCT